MDLLKVTPLLSGELKALFVGVDDLLVALHGENQCDVHADALGQCGGDRRQRFVGSRDLDHRIRAGDLLPQLACLVDRLLLVVRIAGIYLDGNAPVAAVRVLVDTGEYVARLLHIKDAHAVDGFLRGDVLCAQLLQLAVVVAAGANRRRKDRRVGGNA